MFRYIMVVLATLFFTGSAMADSDFYNKPVGNWVVYGNHNSKNNIPHCIIEMRPPSGDLFQVVQDLKDGEIYFFITNKVWDLTPKDARLKLTIGVYNNNLKGKAILQKESNLDWILVSGNSIVIPKLNADNVVTSLETNDSIRIKLPTSTDVLVINLGSGGKQLISSMAECIETFKHKTAKGQEI